MKTSSTEKNQNTKQRDEILRRSFDAAPDLIMILDTDHKILQANKAMAKKMPNPKAKKTSVRRIFDDPIGL